MSAPRKLAAILAADVAGYSRLTDLDEEGTLKRLRRLRREHDQPGRGAPSRPDRQDPGDGVLIEFPSVVDAVRCALDARRGMDGRNADVPADQRLQPADVSGGQPGVSQSFRQPMRPVMLPNWLDEDLCCWTTSFSKFAVDCKIRT